MAKRETKTAFGGALAKHSNSNKIAAHSSRLLGALPLSEGSADIHTTQMVEDFLGYLLVSNERKVVMRLAFWDRTCAPSTSWSYNFLEQNKRNDGSFFAFSDLVPVTCNSNFYMYQPPPWSFTVSPVQDNTQGFSSQPK